MFNYNRKKYRFLTPARKSDESILDRPEFMYPEPKSAKQKEDTAGLWNYLRKPKSETGSTALFASLVAVFLTALSFHSMIRSLGSPPLYTSALVLSAVLFSVYSILCGLVSFLEKDRSHLNSCAGLSIGGIVLISWLITMFVGM